MQRTVAASFGLLAWVTASVVPAFGAQIAFVGPKAWSKVDTGQTSTDTSRTFDQWKLGGGQEAQTVTVIHDTTTSYDTSLATMLKNFGDNGIKPTTNKDVTCQGRTAHVVEYQIGPEGHEYITNRMLLSDGATGVVTVTYSRAKGYNFDDDVKEAEDTFCKAAS
jgi:hypothetical protein